MSRTPKRCSPVLNRPSRECRRDSDTSESSYLNVSPSQSTKTQGQSSGGANDSLSARLMVALRKLRRCKPDELQQAVEELERMKRDSTMV